MGSPVQDPGSATVCSCSNLFYVQLTCLASGQLVVNWNAFLLGLFFKNIASMRSCCHRKRTFPTFTLLSNLMLPANSIKKTCSVERTLNFNILVLVSLV